jgi:hypothetical protein
MVERGMTDRMIGAVYGVEAQTIYHVRKRLGIPAAERSGIPMAAPTPLETYVDEDGLTVKRCPTRYAVEMQPRTARPRR